MNLEHLNGGAKATTLLRPRKFAQLSSRLLKLRITELNTDGKKLTAKLLPKKPCTLTATTTLHGKTLKLSSSEHNHDLKNKFI